jgi:hypothetical protein
MHQKIILAKTRRPHPLHPGSNNVLGAIQLHVSALLSHVDVIAIHARQ